MSKIKLNVGASPIWKNDDWYILDHKKSKFKNAILGDASSISLDDNSVEVIFCSHVIEHIPQIKIVDVFNEFNRVLKPGGILRILSPDLLKIATAYVNKDKDFFEKALKEDSNIRTDMGYGGILANWFVSPGQDTILLDRNLSKFITGQAHQIIYDFEMLTVLLSNSGFDEIKQKEFCDSDCSDFKVPLHVDGLKPIWQNFNQEFYKKNNLIHIYNQVTGKYEINFSVRGFDRDPLTSLIVECRKSSNGVSNTDFTLSRSNYNKYGYSLLFDPEIRKKLDKMGIEYENPYKK
tara:strand:- start:623 stop:1498 length:876 start_codon:yes stop_codon:yes gene_type:complete